MKCFEKNKIEHEKGWIRLWLWAEQIICWSPHKSKTNKVNNDQFWAILSELRIQKVEFSKSNAGIFSYNFGLSEF